MSESAEHSLAFYERLGAAGLAQRTRPELDSEDLRRFRAMVPDGSRVLDVGCGYGRITLGFAAEGVDVVGVEPSPNLLQAAREGAADSSLDVPFVRGSMTALGLASDRFDAVLCLWSTFNELLDPEEQAGALCEMWRVVCGGGFVLVELPSWAAPTPGGLAGLGQAGLAVRIQWEDAGGVSIPHHHYRHDEQSLFRLCREVGLADRAEVYEHGWAGRLRLFLRLTKP